MRGHVGASPHHDRLQDEVQILRDRLHRVTIALSITEEMLAAACDLLAETSSVHSTQQRLEAERARSAAAECRAFAIRLDELRPAEQESRDGSVSSPS